MLSALLIAGASFAADAEPNPAPPVRAHANLGEIFGTEDYPWPALIRSEQGVVRFRVDVDSAGQVTDCLVTGTSGSDTLDQATCRIMRERARYTPARDAAGTAVEDRLSAQITWQLPPGPEMRARAHANLASYVRNSDYPDQALRVGQQGIVAFALVVSPEGRVTHCEVLQSSGSAQLDGRTCQIMEARARFEPARDSDGLPTEDIVTAYVTCRVFN